jgi:hypothetical protein
VDALSGPAYRIGGDQLFNHLVAIQDAHYETFGTCRPNTDLSTRS